MRLEWLADAFREAGLKVVEEPDWKARGRSWSPKGLMQHHTAPPVPYPTSRLYGVRIKCNWNTKPDGTIHVISAGACNYSSGRGAGIVLAQTMDEIAPSGSARKRGLSDTMGGNLHYINDETDHWGDGSPIPGRQWAAAVISKGVVCERLGWSENRLIGHGEWTRRKIDPRWNGKLIHANMNDMRAAVRDYINGNMGPPATGGGYMYNDINFEQGYGTNGDPDVLNWQKVFAKLGKTGSGLDGKAGPNFFKIVDDLCGSTGSRYLGPVEGAQIFGHFGGTPPDMSGYMQVGKEYAISTGKVEFSE